MKFIRKKVKLIVIISFIVILGVTGGILFSGMFLLSGPQQQNPQQELLAQCEVQEANISLVHNRTLIPVTDAELDAFPGLGSTLQQAYDSSGSWVNGYRGITDFEANISHYYDFVHRVCRDKKTMFECFPQPPLFEYRGRYYDIQCLELYYHTTARPMPSPEVTNLPERQENSSPVTNGCSPQKPCLEVYDPGTGRQSWISRDQAGYAPLLNNMTTIFRSIKGQLKCAVPYDEFQVEKREYRYVTFTTAGTVTGRYCYNNITAECMNVSTDEFTVLLQKKVKNSTDETCSESNLIFTYRNGTDAGMWSLGEGDTALIDALDKNVREIIDRQH